MPNFLVHFCQNHAVHNFYRKYEWSADVFVCTLFVCACCLRRTAGNYAVGIAECINGDIFDGDVPEAVKCIALQPKCWQFAFACTSYQHSTSFRRFEMTLSLRPSRRSIDQAKKITKYVYKCSALKNTHTSVAQTAPKTEDVLVRKHFPYAEPAHCTEIVGRADERGKSERNSGIPDGPSLLVAYTAPTRPLSKQKPEPRGATSIDSVARRLGTVHGSRVTKAPETGAGERTGNSNNNKKGIQPSKGTAGEERFGHKG